MSPSKPNPRSAGEWAAVLPTYVGIAGLVFCAAFWAITDRVEPAFLTTFGGLLAIGQGAEALQSLRGGRPQGADSPAPSRRRGG